MIRNVYGSLVFAAAFGLFAVLSPSARALPVGIGQVLDINLSFSSPPQPAAGGAFGPIDTLIFTVSDTNLNFSSFPPEAIARLYNGTTLLGTVNFSPLVFQEFSFVSPTSLFSFPYVGVVSDFSSIANGTLDGLLQIVLLNGSADLDISVNALGTAVSSNGVVDASVNPTITGEAVVSAVPEPASGLLLLGGLMALGIFGWRRTRAGERAVAVG